MKNDRGVIDRRNVPFIMVTRAVYEDETLKAADKALYSALCMYWDKEIGECIAPRCTLISKAGISDYSFRASIKRLQDSGYIRVRRRYSRNGGQLTNSYVISAYKGISEKVLFGRDGQTISYVNWDNKPKWYKEMYDYFGRACALSGAKHNVTIDHVLPKHKKKGINSKGNLLPLSLELNASKGTEDIFEWFKDNKRRFNLSDEKFHKAMSYLARQKGLSLSEYYYEYKKDYEEYTISVNSEGVGNH